MAGAAANRRTKVKAEFGSHAKQIARQVADQFQPVYERVCRERDQARFQTAILQTAVELIAAGCPGSIDPPEAIAQSALDQLGITADIQTGDGG